MKGGPFRSRINYEEITRVTRTNDILTGYRVMSSGDAIEIFYRTAALGSVKIPPNEQEKFIEELKKRCPNVKVDI